jgi:DNA-binding response OmpR family regulator
MSDPIYVLVVDGNVNSRKRYRAVLEEAGYIVDTAENGEEALEKVRTSRFDVALIDVELSDVEDAEFFLKLPNNEEMIKIVTSSFSTVEQGIKMADYGVDDFLVKPFRPKELIDAIRNAVLRL